MTAHPDPPRRSRSARPRPHHAGPGPLLRAQLEPRRGPPAVRHGRQGVPRLRQRDRGHGPRPPPPGGDRGDPRPGRPAHRADRRDRLLRARRSASPTTLAGDVPGAARHGLLPELGLGGDRGRAQARPPGHRPARASSPSAARSTAGRSGRRRVTSSNLNYRRGYEPLLPGVYLAPVPGRLPRLRRRRGAGDRALPARPPRPDSRASSRPTQVAAILIEPVQGEGGYTPGAGRVPARPPGVLRRARHPAHRRRGPDRATGGPARMWAFEHAGIVPDVVCLAKAIANGLPLSAIVELAGAPGALGARRPRLDVRRQPGRLRGRASRSCETIRERGPRRERRRARRGAHGRPARGSRPRTTGSATSAGPG